MRSSGALVGSSPQSHKLQHRLAFDGGSEKFLAPVSEPPPVPLPLRFAQFERGIQNAAWLEDASQVRQHTAHLVSPHMQERRACPDAIKLLLEIHLIEPPLARLHTSVLSRKPNHFSGGIQGNDSVTALLEDSR